MALMLICRRNLYAQAFINGSRISASLPAFNPANPSIITCAPRYIRTSGAGSDGVYDTPHVRKNSASANLTLPQPEFEPVNATSGSRNENNDSVSSSSTIKLSQIDKKRDVLKENLVVFALTCLTKTYDLLTLPIYAAIQQPWKKRALHNTAKAALVEGKQNEWKSLIPKSKMHMELDEYNIDTLDKLLSHAIEKHGSRRCLGSREVHGVVEVTDDFGKPLKKYDLGDYTWMTYGDIGIAARNLCHGLSSLGLKPRDRIGIFAETRAEWMLTAVAAFKMNLQICTVFATLGDDGVVHALNETEVSCLITSDELMPRCKDILKETPLIKNVIYMNKNSEAPPDLESFPRDIKVQPLTSLMSLGESMVAAGAAGVESPPEPDDTAIIMYTSGSTGIPKGVVLSHWNLVSALRSVTDTVASAGEPDENDVYIAYLPLAHALELMSESMCLLQGIQIGYSSPLTMTDQSIGVKTGCKGDASLLKPTVLTAVPLVLERILKGIHGKVSDKGQLTTTLFNFFYNYKVRWSNMGYDTPLVDRIFFRPIRDLIGGQVRLVVCGGAPLAAQTHEFMRAILGCPVLQGYGLTETSGNGALACGHDLSIGRVGGPIPCSRFRLVDWEEGGYRVTDKPNPRGEIYIGGDNVAMGYFKKADCTDFFVEDGIRWVRTGDIAEAYPDGVFRIIDRKKDLVKLATGEYISLGKIEAILKTCPYVENICVYADTSYPYPVAVMVASQAKVEALAAKLGVSAPNFSQLTKDPVIVDAVLAEIQQTAAALKLQKWETPRKIYISPEMWMPQSGLVTAAFKIKRNNVYSAFRKELDDMLATSDNAGLPLFQTT